MAESEKVPAPADPLGSGQVTGTSAVAVTAQSGDGLPEFGMPAALREVGESGIRGAAGVLALHWAAQTAAEINALRQELREERRRSSRLADEKHSAEIEAERLRGLVGTSTYRQAANGIGGLLVGTAFSNPDRLELAGPLAVAGSLLFLLGWNLKWR